LGSELLDEVQATLPLIGTRPHSFPRLQDVDATLEIRRALLARFPYALVFLVREDEVRVLAVAHAKRRPGYWLSRVRR
jgi:plasmid stabilization system protein ParE